MLMTSRVEKGRDARRFGRGFRAACLGALMAHVLGLATVAGAADSLLAPLGDPAWADAPLPSQKLPPTLFEPISVDGRAGWRLSAQGSYGNRVHPSTGAAATAGRLEWRWRLERPIDGADLVTKAGDDAAIKVCVLFDLPDDRVPFMERQLLRLARSVSQQALPGATLCYVWAPLAREGAVVSNAYTRRMRWKILRGIGSPLATWQTERRDLRADFLEAFGDEVTQMPPLSAVLVGADADNTGGRGEARIVDLVLRP